MKGTKQAECSGCGLEKGTHDRNAGWWELHRRGRESMHELVFCPACSAALLVGLDERLGGRGKNPNLRAVLVGDLERLRRLLTSMSEVEFVDYEMNLEVETLLRWLGGVL